MKAPENRNKELADLFQTHYGHVVACARRVAPSPEIVADIVQQVFVQWIEHADRWDLDADVPALLRGMTRNIALEQIRDAYRHSLEGMTKIAEFRLRLWEENETRREDVGTEEKIVALTDCLETLPPKSRDLLDEHYRRQTTIRAIAAQLHMNENAVAQAFVRIRNKLRACIEARLKRDKTDE